MFEKEAEEYANGKGHENYKNTGCLFDFARLCFQDSAEFGYNKALEEATHNYNAIIADYDKHIEELEKENAELKKQLGDVIECFTSSSSGDDFEMAESAREVMEVLNISCYRHG